MLTYSLRNTQAYLYTSGGLININASVRNTWKSRGWRMAAVIKTLMDVTL